jgi:hypothetical protein
MSATNSLPSGYVAKGIPNCFPDRDGSEEKEIAYLHYLISGIALNNTIMIVPTNLAMVRLAINFNCRMRILGNNNVLFWALDKSAASVLQEYSIPTYFNPAFFSSDILEGYHSENYNKMMQERPKLWRTVVKTGYHMLFLDVDIGILRHPMLDLVGDADLEGQVDEHGFWHAVNINAFPQMCGGAFFLKSNERTIRFLNRMEKALVEKEGGIVDDQQAINLAIHNLELARILNRFKRHENGTDIPYGGFSNGPDDNRLTVRFIPADQYLNGHLWGSSAVERDPDGNRMTWTEGERRQFEPALVHLNGKGAKEDEMKQFGWWYIKNDLNCPLPKVQSTASA